MMSLLDQIILWLKVGGQHWIFVGGGVGWGVIVSSGFFQKRT